MSEELYKKRDQETPFQYHKRLIYGKLIDKTIDLDYEELSELVYGQHYSSDVMRRMMYGSRKTLELLDDNCIDKSDIDLVNELNDKILEAKKETKKLQDQRREYNKLSGVDARREHLYDRLAEAAENLNDTVGDTLLVCEHTGNYNYGNEAILVLSDWHYGLVSFNVFNEYNCDICKERVEKVVDDTINRLLLHKISKLHIVVLGDLFHGAIHVGTRVAAEELVCDQLMQVSEILARAIEILSAYVETVDVYTTYGNHARTIQKKDESVHSDNMEKIIPWWLYQRLKDKNIYFPNANIGEFILFDVCDHTFCATHGDLDTVRAAPRLLSTLFQKSANKNIEYILVGDKHHRESFDELGITAMMVGSLCGTDDYADQKRLYSTPSQLLLIVNKDDGVDAEYRIKV